MIAIEHKVTKERQNVESLRGYDAATWQQVATLPAGATGDLSLFVGAAENVALVESILITSIKAEAERRKMLWLSPGGAKKAEYADKRAEVAYWDSLGGTVTAILAAIAGLTAAARTAKFSYAIADAAAFGEPNISGAIERFRAGMTSSASVPAIAAAEAKACSTVKAASTASAKRAAANAFLRS